MDLDKVDAMLDRIDKTGLALVPIIGTVGNMARLFIGMAHKMGLDTKPFEGVIVELDAALLELHGSTADFRTKFPRVAGAPATSVAPTADGPAPGETTTIGE